MREQSKAFQKTVWQGVLIGAAAGSIWGLVQGDKGSDVLKKALIGGAVGGLAGAYIGHKQNQFSSKEDVLDSMISDVRKSNQETKELIASVREVIAEDKRRLADVQKRYKKGQATEAEVASTRKRIGDNQAVVAQASKGAREKYKMFEGAEQEYRKQNPATSTAGLQSELNTFNGQIATLDGLAGSIAQA
jgi:chromosome segregation ATPase